MIRIVLLGLFSAMLTLSAEALDYTVSGRVTSKRDNTPLARVSITVKGTSQGTTSDAEGKYTLTVPPGQAVLVYSFIGFITREIDPENRTVVDVQLKEDVKALSEVVVIGYGRQERSTLAGARISTSARIL